MTVTSMRNRELVRIPLDRIQETIVQLRSEYLDEPLGELGDSIEDEGVLEPILVAPAENDNYELIIGSRRLRAAKRKRFADIPAIVIEQRSPLNYILMALAENLHRQDLNAFEEARAFLRLMKDYGLGVQEVARQTRKGENYVRSRIELLSLPEAVQSMISEKSLGLQHVPVLAGLPSGEEQVHYAERAVSDRLAQAELRAVINRESGEDRLQRFNTDRLSAEKVRVRVDMFTAWLGKIPYKTAIKRMNMEERLIIAEALHALEVQIRTIRGMFTSRQSTRDVYHVPSAGNLGGDRRNHGGEWPSGDIAKIIAVDRPSDEALSRELGRNVSAIQAMRARMERESKRGHKSP